MSGNKVKENPNSADSSLPLIGITMGDPSGIGPEITLKALTDSEILKCCVPLIIGDLGYLRRSAKSFGIPIGLNEASENGRSEVIDGIQVIDLDNLREDFTLGKESAVSGKAAGEYIEKSVDLWKQGKLDGIVTAPINKKALAMGGYDYPGHTEFLAALTDTRDFAMSFFAGKLCVVLLSTHVPLKEALGLVTKERLIDLIQFTDRRLSSLLNRSVKIAVAGLNPHASEDGMFGTEEESQISPAIVECREELGINVSGPYSPDTVFLRGFDGEFDAVVSCYHDQATIAVKCLSFGASVNVTLGLPLIRTSVDHGTAYDIAGKNVADSSSLEAAIKLASELAGVRKKS